MKNLINKLLFLSLLFAGNLHAVAGDTIKYINRGDILCGITASLDKQFTIRCIGAGIEQTYTGTGDYQHILISTAGNDPEEIIIEGEEDCAFTVFTDPFDHALSIDLSKSPSIEYLFFGSGPYDQGELSSINLSNCVNLESLAIGGGRIRELDLSDCKALSWIECYNNELSTLDINLTNNPAITGAWCEENHLQLSNLFALSELISNPWSKAFARQTLGTRKILLVDTLDYSSQKEFGGVATDFYIMRGKVTSGYDFTDDPPLAPSSDYTIENGLIMFHKEGTYTVDMRNRAIVQNSTFPPARVLVWVNVLGDYVPVAEITDIPVSITVGTSIYLNSLRKVLPANATFTLTTWQIIDAGTTGASLYISRLKTTAHGTVTIRATIRDGAALGVNYTQDFVIEVKPSGIEEDALLSEINVIPNPTMGELHVTSDVLHMADIEIFDISGKKITSHHLITSSSNHLINITHLPAGIYFLKIYTNAGEVVKKIIKQ